MNITNQESFQIQRKPEVLKAHGLKASTFQNRINDGLICSAINLGARAVGYLRSETEAIIKHVSQENQMRK